jgi:hypothetical protein
MKHTVIENLKRNLGYVCRVKNGYLNELIDVIGQDATDSFILSGFIKTGVTLKHYTWSKLKLADEYYKDTFGMFSFYKNKLGLCFNR